MAYKIPDWRAVLQPPHGCVARLGFAFTVIVGYLT